MNAKKCELKDKMTTKKKKSKFHQNENFDFLSLSRNQN